MLSLTFQNLSAHLLTRLGEMIESGHLAQLRVLDLTGSLPYHLMRVQRRWRSASECSWQMSHPDVQRFKETVDRLNREREQQSPPASPLLVLPRMIEVQSFFDTPAYLEIDWEFSSY